jgi:hypothetical protein
MFWNRTSSSSAVQVFPSVQVMFTIVRSVLVVPENIRLVFIAGEKAVCVSTPPSERMIVAVVLNTEDCPPPPAKVTGIHGSEGIAFLETWDRYLLGGGDDIGWSRYEITSHGGDYCPGSCPWGRMW